MLRSSQNRVRRLAIATVVLLTSLAAIPSVTFAGETPPDFRGVWPTHGELTTLFGVVDRYAPRGHSGIDIAAPRGTPVVAADAGVVLKAYWNGEGYGGLIVVAHPSGYETWYAHLGQLGVASGEPVKRGEEIGLMGSTGFSTGSHLHFEIRQDGHLCDPLMFLDESRLEPADLP